MALKVIGAGLGRTGTFSLKFALEHIGFSRCYHMSEVLASASRSISLWIDASKGKPNWNEIFDGFQATMDYPGCVFWEELADYYPDAKVVLTQRDPNSWFDSVSETIFSEHHRASFRGSPLYELLDDHIYSKFGDRISDREFMTDYFRRRNQEVIDTIPASRLLIFSPKEGWEPLCEFLGVPVPPEPFPRVNSRDEMRELEEGRGGIPADPEAAEIVAREIINQFRTKAFGD